MANDFRLKNKHTINIFQAQVRDLAKDIKAQPKKHNAYKKKTCTIKIDDRQFGFMSEHDAASTILL